MRADTLLPERLNLAVARRCPVACRGCYSLFGAGEPDLPRLTASVAVFAALGFDRATVSGGDPLSIAGLPEWLGALRTAGMASIKVDTVGVGLLADDGAPSGRLLALWPALDQLGIPLDGADNRSVLVFRQGRAALCDETLALLDALDGLGGAPRVTINTVVHAGNCSELAAIGRAVLRRRCVSHWNLFQYTATDQAGSGANPCFALTDAAFERACAGAIETLGAAGQRGQARIDLRSSRSRLGHYLLVNSDGDAWLPDDGGRTLRLGSVFGHEREVLDAWRAAVERWH